uniref:TsaA-like domain-containing protein n=1 Tax=Eutreptiella gymnastica TaxID=73025 RepID=A0A7S1IBB4_9EUGL|mmetsp:Transcript_143407/g.250334  ORF Transcript_143407/g.250334 Transcript_143407/m.250334 type:complete len:335 (+) Transcript_143407:99-1103(+)
MSEPVLDPSSSQCQRLDTLESEIKSLQEQLELRKTQYEAERKARAKVERQLQRTLQHELQTSQGIFVQPIGHLDSCFPNVVGTPRQGALAPSTRAKIVFAANVSPHTFEGLEDFSHVWITFLFHLNTNIKANKDRPGATAVTYSAKITPPMLQHKVGIFATRSPHRPNPVGFTLARLQRICAQTKTLYVSGVDLVQGTPILDIKPYVPYYDCVPEDQLQVASWISTTIGTRREVTMPEHVREQLKELMPHQKFYRDDFVQMCQAIIETLAVDVKSQRQKQYAERNANCCVQVLDQVVVEYTCRTPSEGGPANVLITRVHLYVPNTLQPLDGMPE